MDVNQQTVIELYVKYGATCLIHGHTHHAGVHNFTNRDQKLSRIVLGDWDGCCSILIISIKTEKNLLPHALS